MDNGNCTGAEENLNEIVVDDEDAVDDGTEAEGENESVTEAESEDETERTPDGKIVRKKAEIGYRRRTRIELVGEEMPDEEEFWKKEYDKCLESALRIIMFGDNSRKMMRDKLLMRGYRPDIVGKIISKFCEKKLISDGPLIKNMTETMVNKKYFGRIRVRQELLKRFDRDSVEIYFDSVVEEIDFESPANEFANNNLKSGKERLIRAMAARGYEAELIKKAVDAAIEALPPRPETPKTIRNGKTPRMRRTF